jgi:hypothetical protein
MSTRNFITISTPDQVLFTELVQAALDGGFYILSTFYDHSVDMEPVYVAYLQKPLKDAE